MQIDLPKFEYKVEHYLFSFEAATSTYLTLENFVVFLDEISGRSASFHLVAPSSLSLHSVMKQL